MIEYIEIIQGVYILVWERVRTLFAFQGYGFDWAAVKELKYRNPIIYYIPVIW